MPTARATIEWATALTASLLALSGTIDARAQSGDGPPADRFTATSPARVSRPDPRNPLSRIHRTVYRRLDEAGADGRVKAWILFTDKDAPRGAALNGKLDGLALTYNPRAVERRRLRRTRIGLFDEQDLPVSPRYVANVRAIGATLRHVSRWVNGISVLATQAQIEDIARLPYVHKIQPVRRGRGIKPERIEELQEEDAAAPGNDRFADMAGGVAGGTFYGSALEQLTQIGLINVHALGYTGGGVVIGILDTGFDLNHVAFNEPGHEVVPRIVAQWDFVDDDPVVGEEPGDPAGQDSHGTYILGTLAAYKPNTLVAAAYDASFILCKTEDTSAEYPAEEDNYVAGLEFIEANGGDMVTSSLGYIDWYTQADLDGMTAVTTIAVNAATANGLHCCNAAGNGGHDSNPSTAHLIAPADAPRVIACGAVDSVGVMAGFSSDGPTADGRVKPEVLARGVNTRTVSAISIGGYTGVNGTSLSTPLVAGAVACLIDARPDWTVDHMRARLFDTADDYIANGTFDPEYVRGFGVINAMAALTESDCNGNGVDDALEIQFGISDDTNGNGLPDDCDMGACCPCPPGPPCAEISLEACNEQGGHFTENASCGGVSCPGAPPANDECAAAVAITDGTYALDTRCATTDGPAATAGSCEVAGAFDSDVWFTYVATCSYRASITVTTADFGAMVAVYCDGSGDCLCPDDASTEYACDAESGAGATVDVPVTEGRCYRVRVGGADGTHGVGTMEVTCRESSCVPASPPQPAPEPMATNRYLSFVAGEAGREQALRVTLRDLPPPFDAWNDTVRWVGPPFAVSESPALPDATPPTITVAPLQCDPLFQDWSGFGTIHAFGDMVLPGGAYDIQAVDSSCYIAPTACSDGFGPFEATFSSSLTLSTSAWGDLAGAFNGLDPQWLPPDGSIDVSADFIAVLDKFIARPGAPSKIRADLEPATPDFIINITDAVYVLDAFRGLSYPFPPNPDPCP